jgi:hypothetical protein
MMENLQTLILRRSVYDLNKDIKVKKEEIVNVLETVLKHTPSAYNSQSQRMVLLVDKYHEIFWDMVKSAIKKVTSEQDFEKSAAKMNMFKAAYGTVLFFDDFETTEGLTRKFPLYKKNFLDWARQQNGMMQINVWNSFASLGLGASLQHYNELIQDEVKSVFKLPGNWVLDAQMPFGNIVKLPVDKDKLDLKERFIILE